LKENVEEYLTTVFKYFFSSSKEGWMAMKATSFVLRVESSYWMD